MIQPMPVSMTPNRVKTPPRMAHTDAVNSRKVRRLSPEHRGWARARRRTSSPGRPSRYPVTFKCSVTENVAHPPPVQVPYARFFIFEAARKSKKKKNIKRGYGGRGIVRRTLKKEKRRKANQQQMYYDEFKIPTTHL